MYRVAADSKRAISLNYILLILIDTFIFVLLSRESDGVYIGEIQTRVGLVFVSEFFRLSYASDCFSLLLVRFHQAVMMIVKHLIRERNNEAWVGVEPSTLRS